MFLSRSRYEEIKEVIVDLFLDYNIRDIPIDVFALAKKMQIAVVKYEDFTVSQQDILNTASEDGMSYYRPSEKRYYIVYKDVGYTGRVRFTIAHEIGHIVLGHSESNQEAEVEANFFAKYLLVPEVILVYNQISNIDVIMGQFDVSQSCAEAIISALSTRYRYWGWRVFPPEMRLLQQFGFRGCDMN